MEKVVYCLNLKIFLSTEDPSNPSPAYPLPHEKKIMIFYRAQKIEAIKLVLFSQHTPLDLTEARQ